MNYMPLIIRFEKEINRLMSTLLYPSARMFRVAFCSSIQLGSKGSFLAYSERNPWDISDKANALPPSLVRACLTHSVQRTVIIL